MIEIFQNKLIKIFALLIFARDFNTFAGNCPKLVADGSSYTINDDLFFFLSCK